MTAALIATTVFYAHSFEQWLVESMANILKIYSFSSYITKEIFNWIPTIFVGFLLSALIYTFTFEPGRIWWVLLAASILSVLSAWDRKSYWTDEPPFVWEIMVDARHRMYFFGALVAVLVVRLVRNKLTSASSGPG